MAMADHIRAMRGRRGAGGSTGFARLPAWSRAAVIAWSGRQLTLEAEARSGFFLVPAGMMLGIALFHAGGVRPPIWAAAGLAIPLLGAAWHLGARGAAGLGCLGAGFVAVGLGLSGAELARTRTTIFAGEATVHIEGTVENRERDARGRLRYRVAISRTERPTLSRPPELAEILVSSRHAPLPIGGRYAGLVRLRAPSGPAFPASYDFGFGNFFDGLGAHGFALGPPAAAPNATGPPARRGVGERLLQLRLWMSDRIRAVVAGPEGAVAAALITGDRAGIPEEIDLWLRTTGLSHVLSISGLHMALVAGFAMLLVRAGLAAIPYVALRFPIKKLAAVAALAVVTFYILLSGRNVAADRSYIMLAIMLVAVMVDRSAITLRNVSLAAIVVLAMAPHALMTASFQMSFGATAALVGIYGAYARIRARRAADAPVPTWPRRLALFVLGLGASSVIAGAATGPFAAYHFQRLAPFGLFANLLALPLFSVWIMPLALIAVLAMPLGLDAPLLHLMGFGLTAVFEIAHFLHDRLPDTPTGLLTASGTALLAVALMLGCFLASRLRWLALPVALAGLVLAPDRSPRPELLVFEDGRELAVIDSEGTLLPLRAKPNGFVLEQWQRAFPDAAAGTRPAGAHGRGAPGTGAPATVPKGFVCEPLAVAEKVERTADGAGTGPSASAAALASAVPGLDRPAPPPVSGKPAATAPRPMQICRATTRSGLKVVWTDDYRQTGAACDGADLAIVARAIRLEACRSGAALVTLRTLRRTGSLAVTRSAETGRLVVARSVAAVPEPWQIHRLAPWPEAWRRSPAAATTAR